MDPQNKPRPLTEEQTAEEATTEKIRADYREALRKSDFYEAMRRGEIPPSALS